MSKWCWCALCSKGGPNLKLWHRWFITLPSISGYTYKVTASLTHLVKMTEPLCTAAIATAIGQTKWDQPDPWFCTFFKFKSTPFLWRPTITLALVLTNKVTNRVRPTQPMVLYFLQNQIWPFLWRPTITLALVLTAAMVTAIGSEPGTLQASPFQIHIVVFAKKPI